MLAGKRGIAAANDVRPHPPSIARPPPANEQQLSHLFSDQLAISDQPRPVTVGRDGNGGLIVRQLVPLLVQGKSGVPHEREWKVLL